MSGLIVMLFVGTIGGFFSLLGAVFIVFGIRSKLHVQGRCGAVLVEANCLEVKGRDQRMDTNSSTSIGTYHLKTKVGVYEYYYEGQRYQNSPLLATNLKKYAPQYGACQIAINPKKPQKIYAPAGNAMGNIFLFIGSLFVILPIIVCVITMVVFAKSGLL